MNSLARQYISNVGEREKRGGGRIGVKDMECGSERGRRGGGRIGVKDMECGSERGEEGRW